MSKSINLSGLQSAELRFWYKIPSIESGIDRLRVWLDGALLWDRSSAQLVWTEVALNVSSYVGSSHTLKFEFYSDASVTAEGAYLDDIFLQGESLCDHEFVASDVRLTFGGVSRSCPVTLSGGQSVGGTFDSLQRSPDGNAARHRVAVGFRNSAGAAVGNCVEMTALDSVPASCTGRTVNDATIPSGLAVPTAAGTYTLWAEDYLTVGSPCALFQDASNAHTAEQLLKKKLCVVTVPPPCDHEFVASDVRLTFGGVSRSCPVTLSGGQSVGGTFDSLQRSPDGNAARHRVAVGFRNSAGAAVGNCVEMTALDSVPASCTGRTVNDAAIPSELAVPTAAGTYTLWAEDYLTVGAPCALFQDASNAHTAEQLLRKKLCVVTVVPCDHEFVASDVRLTFGGVSRSCPVTLSGGQSVGGTFDSLQRSPDGNAARHRVAVGFRNSAGAAVGTCVEVTALDSVPASCTGRTVNDAAIPSGLAVPTAAGTYTLWAEDYLTVGAPCALFQDASNAHTTEQLLKKQLCVITVCNYTISPANGAAIPACGGNTTVSILTGTTCNWSVSGLCTWLSVSPSSGTGNGTLTFTAQSNTTGSSRTCNVTIGDRTYPITQAPCCTITVAPTSWTAPACGGSTTLTVSAGSGCSWSVSGLCSWLSASPSSGTGNSSVTLTAQSNTTGTSRSCTVTIGGQNLTFSQAACPQATATHSAACYRSPGVCVVEVEVSYPLGSSLLSLLCKPSLPGGWTLAGVAGDGMPEIQGGEIVFIGSLTVNPVRFRFTNTVPPGVTGNQSIQTRIDYQLSGMANPITIYTVPDPLVVTSCSFHTLDCNKDWVINGTEANRALAYWRAGGYHCDPAGCDGAAPGQGSCGACYSSADCDRNCLISGTEVNRVLAYWRAGGYHPDPAGCDSFAPGPQGQAAAAGLNQGTKAMQSGPEIYLAGESVQISGRVEGEGNLLSLLWRPRLPAGWQLVGVSGDGNPELVNGEIVWTGQIPPSPIQVAYEVSVPAIERGIREVFAEIEAHCPGQANPVKVASPGLRLPDVKLHHGAVGPNGNIEFTLTGRPEATYEVQYSPDLVHWERLDEYQTGSGSVLVADPTLAGHQQRFYRCVPR